MTVSLGLERRVGADSLKSQNKCYICEEKVLSGRKLSKKCF